MSKQREALKIALEVLDSKHNFNSAEWRVLHYRAFQVIRETLAEPEQEPVAWMCPHDPERETAFAWRAGMCESSGCGHQRVPLYAAPPQRKPLTEQEPVAWMYHGILHNGTPDRPRLIWRPEFMDAMSGRMGAKATPLYTAPPQQAEPVEPVFEVGFGWLDDATKYPKGTKLYTAPPQRKPLTDNTLWEMWVESPSDVMRFARAIERAHGIGEA